LIDWFENKVIIMFTISNKIILKECLQLLGMFGNYIRRHTCSIAPASYWILLYLEKLISFCSSINLSQLNAFYKRTFMLHNY